MGGGKPTAEATKSSRVSAVTRFQNLCLTVSPEICTSAISFSPALLVRSVTFVLLTFSAGSVVHAKLTATTLLTGVFPCLYPAGICISLKVTT